VSLLSRLRLADSKSRPPSGELGDSGVGFGQGKTRRLLDTEYLWDLRGAAAYRMYDRMRFSDPKVNGLRAAQNLPVLRASVTIEPTDEKDKDALAKAEFVQDCLIDNFPWRAFLSDSLLATDFGFAPFEIVWRVDERGKVVVDRLAYRPPSSIAAEDITIEKGAVARITQRPATGGTYEIPGEKLLWFCYGKEGDDARGKPILRPMYKPWKLKEELEVELAVLIGKMGGVPDIKTLGIVDDATATALDEAGASFGLNDGAFVRHSDDVEISLLASNARVGEVLSAIRYFDTQLSQVCMAQVLDLGANQVGSRALGTTLSDMFTDSIQALCSYREDVLNAKGGLIYQLVDYNFPNTENMPSLRFGNVQRNDLTAMADAFQKLGAAGMNFGDEVWDWVRAEMNLPERPDDVPASAPPKPVVSPFPQQAPPETAPSPAQTPSAAGGAPEAAGAKASETAAASLKLAERREPHGVECYAELAEIATRFDDAKTAVRVATQATRDALAAELAKRARIAAKKDALTKFAAGAPPMVDKLTNEIAAVLSEFYEAGHAQVADELRRQREGKPVVEEKIERRQDGERVLAEKPKKGASQVGSEAAIRRQAEAAARSIAQATLLAAVAQAARLETVPIVDAAIEAAITRESDAAALRFGAIVTDLMQAGRADEAISQATDIEDAVYSAILDGALCEVCEPMDGEVTTDLSEAAEWTPNPGCQGGDRCRCMVFYEVRQETP